MPRGSKELTSARKEEFIRACASLYESMNFKDITIKEIGAITGKKRVLLLKLMSMSRYDMEENSISTQ